MQAASSPFRTAAGVRRALALAGAIAMVVATTACTPDQNVGATATHVGATSPAADRHQHSRDDDERDPRRGAVVHTAHDTTGHHVARDAESHRHNRTPGSDEARAVARDRAATR